MFDVRRLALLRELSIRGTVSATAEAMHLTGPAVSQQLAVLEREAGISLLEKHGRRLALTAAGQLLVSHAGVVLGNLAAAESELAELRGGARGTVRISAFASAARAVVARLWDRHEAATGLDLRLIEQEPELSVPALLRREADVAVVHDYSVLPRDLPDCDKHHLLDDPVLLALRPRDAVAHGLEPGAPARLSGFAGMDWLVPGPETSCHEMIRRACGNAGFVMHITAQATDFSVLAAMVAAGAGAALIPRMALPDSATGLSLHPLTTPIDRSITALTRSGESSHPDVRQVLDDLRRATDAYLTHIPARAPGN
jgi:DNA-binding transcriptional LysR family regulator